MSDRRKGIYSAGFFCLLIGTVLIGVLLGTLSFCCMSSSFLDNLDILQADFVKTRLSLDFGEILLRSLSTSTVYLLAVFLFGFWSVGQPLEFATLLARGMGLGVAISQLYRGFGSKGIMYSAVLVIPAATISSVALAFGVRESVTLSNLYLRYSLSDRQENGLRNSIRIYAAKFLVLEAALAVSAGIDCLCTVIMQRYFLG